MRSLISSTSWKAALTGLCVAIGASALAGPAGARSSAHATYPAGPLGTSYVLRVFGKK